MNNKVIFFGNLADVTGQKEIMVEGQSTVHELFRHLIEQYPNLRMHSFKIIVNDEEINHERSLEEGDEVVLAHPYAE